MRESLRAASEGKPFTPSDRAAIVSRGCLSGVSICVPSPPQAGRGRHGERCAVPRVRESLRAASEGKPFTPKIGRASRRERVCQYVEISVLDGSVTKKTKNI